MGSTMWSTVEDAGMDTSVAEAGSSDYLNIVHDQAKIIQLLKEAIQVLRHRATLLQQNHAISQISENMKVKFDARMTTSVPEAGSSDYLVKIVHDEAIIIHLLEEIRMLHQATLIKNDSLDNLIDNHLRKTREMIKVTESPGTVQQGLLIQHLEEKTGKLLKRIARMEQILQPIDADHQETLKMLGVAKIRDKNIRPLHISLNRFLEICYLLRISSTLLNPIKQLQMLPSHFFSENDEDIAQKINYMKEFFSYYVPPNRVKRRI